MRIAIIGSGGREHAICHKISQSKKVSKIFCLPGNGGTNKIAENVKINIKNFKVLKIILSLRTRSLAINYLWHMATFFLIRYAKADLVK